MDVDANRGNGDGGASTYKTDIDPAAPVAGVMDEETFDWLRGAIARNVAELRGDGQADRDQGLAWLLVESGWEVGRLAAKLGMRRKRVRDFLRFGHFCRFCRDPDNWRASLPCNGGGEGKAVNKEDSTRRRASERLAARKDRTCAHCGGTFTPKNSLGKTCSTRCRVALHRQQQGGR
jgi:hypothetical protein